MAKAKTTGNGKYAEFLTRDGLIKLEGWARAGLSDEQIAKNAGVNRSTLNVWKGKFPEIDKALKKGKEVTDFEVENALYKRALGYDYEEVKQVSEKVGNGNNSKTRTRIEKTTRHVPADTGAMIFWLRNRKADTWSNKEPIEQKLAQANIAYIEAKTALLKGLENDHSLMNVILDAIEMRDDTDGDKQPKKEKED